MSPVHAVPGLDKGSEKGSDKGPERYRRLEKIGHGNFGVVYKGIDTKTKTVVAIKTLDLDAVQDDVASVQQEVSLLSHLSLAKSSNVIKYYESVLVGTKLWIIMDLCSGGSVRTLLKAGPINDVMMSVLFREITVAVDAIHSEGIIHRDIKAANVLVTMNGNVKLCDFGVAAQSSFGNNQRKRMTVVGTPYWMAPEVISEGKGYDSKADIWSLGITVYETVTGKPPYAEHEAMRALMLITNSRPPRLEGPSYSPLLKDFVAQCLDEEPDARPTASDLLKHKYITTYSKIPATTLKELVDRYVKWKVKNQNHRDSLMMFNPHESNQNGEFMDNQVDQGSDFEFDDIQDDELHDVVSGLEEPGRAAEIEEALTDAPNSLREIFGVPPKEEEHEDDMPPEPVNVQSGMSQTQPVQPVQQTQTRTHSQKQPLQPHPHGVQPDYFPPEPNSATSSDSVHSSLTSSASTSQAPTPAFRSRAPSEVRPPKPETRSRSVSVVSQSSNSYLKSADIKRSHKPSATHMVGQGYPAGSIFGSELNIPHAHTPGPVPTYSLVQPSAQPTTFPPQQSSGSGHGSTTQPPQVQQVPQVPQVQQVQQPTSIQSSSQSGPLSAADPIQPPPTQLKQTQPNILPHSHPNSHASSAVHSQTNSMSSLPASLSTNPYFTFPSSTDQELQDSDQDFQYTPTTNRPPPLLQQFHQQSDFDAENYNYFESSVSPNSRSVSPTVSLPESPRQSIKHKKQHPSFKSGFLKQTAATEFPNMPVVDPNVLTDNTPDEIANDYLFQLMNSLKTAMNSVFDVLNE